MTSSTFLLVRFGALLALLGVLFRPTAWRINPPERLQDASLSWR